jgi:poly(beta-D-mannuronate) lyase
MLSGGLGATAVGGRCRRLVDPFVPQRPRRSASLQLDSWICSASTPVVRDVIGIRYYTDQHSTVIDEKLRASNAAANKPLADFVGLVEEAAAAWLASGGTNRPAAKCGLQILSRWAAEGGLLGRVNEQGKSSRRWNTTGLAVAYLALRHTLPEVNAPNIEDWFRRLAEVCRADGERLRNNHLNWTAAAVAASAVAADDQRQWKWAIATARRCIDAIAVDGSLPLELVRGSHALGYHSFALSPLFLIAELARANGEDLYNYSNGGIGRLANFVLRNVAAPNEVIRLTGRQPDKLGTLPWLEIWVRRGGGAVAERLAERQRPVTFAYLGGNQTLLFGP